MTTTTDQPTLVPAHPQRMALGKTAPAFYRAMNALDEASDDAVDPMLAELIRVRASQLNGCAYCVDTHNRDARTKGEREHRLYALAAWRETPFFTVQERAALALTEAVTLLAGPGVPDEVWDEAAEVFSATELGGIVALIVTINAWNAIGVTTRMSPAPRSS
jgi:AhpD family alkylhydroperoxidase